MNNPSLARNSEKSRFFHEPRLHGRSAPREAGITTIGFIVLAIFVSVFAFGVLRLTPVYLNYMKVASALNGVFDEYDSQNPTRAAIRMSISRRFDVDNVNIISHRDIKVIPDNAGFLVVAEYDHTAPFIGNINFTVKFNKETLVRR